MKRTILVGSIALCLVFSLAFVGNTYAQEVNDLELEFYGEVGYTTFADDDFDVEEETPEGTIGLDVSSSLGFMLGGEAKITPEISVAGEYLRFSTSDSDSISGVDPDTGSTVEVGLDADLIMSGFRGNFIYNLPVEEDWPEVRILGGIGYYSGEQEATVSERIDGTLVEEITFEEDDSSIGFKFGAGLKHELMDNLNLKGNIGYRILELEGEDLITGEDIDYDFNGFELSTGLSYTF